MKFSYLVSCLVLHLCQHAHGIFFGGSWLLNFLSPTTTTTTPSPSSSASAGVPTQNFYNISPQVFVSNEVSATGENGVAYSNLVLAIGQNISGTTSRRKRSLFDSVFNTVEDGISNARNVARALTRPVRRRLGVSGRVSGRVSGSGKVGGSGKIGASGSFGGAASSKTSGNSNSNDNSKGSGNSQNQTTTQSGQPSADNLAGKPQSKPQLQNKEAKQSSSNPSSNQESQASDNAANQGSTKNQTQGSGENQNSQSGQASADKSDKNEANKVSQSDQPKENTSDSSETQSSSNPEGQKADKQDTSRPNGSQQRSSPFSSFGSIARQVFPKIPATNQKDQQNKADNSAEQKPSQNQSQPQLNEASKDSQSHPVSEPTSLLPGYNSGDDSRSSTANQDDQPKENTSDSSTTQSSSNPEGQKTDEQDTPRPNGSQKPSSSFPSFGSIAQVFPKIPVTNQEDPQNSNSSLADGIRNRASNFLSGLQDRFTNSPVGGFNPSNISQSFGQDFKNPLAPFSDRLNTTNFLQNFNDGVRDFVDQLANNNSGIQNFIANNNINTSNPIQTFAQLGMNDLIPNPVETLANLSIDQLENQVRDRLNNGLNDVQNAVQGAQSLGSKLGSLIPNMAVNAIKDIQNMIKLSGVIVCVSKQPLPFSNVIQIAANASSKCIAEKVDQAANIWNQTAANLQNAWTDMQKLRDSISECSQRVSARTSGPSPGNAMTLNTCYAAALFNVQSETVLLPLSIAQRIAEGVDLATSLRGHMIKCAADLAHDIATQAYTASQAIAKCIVDSSG